MTFTVEFLGDDSLRASKQDSSLEAAIYATEYVDWPQPDAERAIDSIPHDGASVVLIDPAGRSARITGRGIVSV